MNNPNVSRHFATEPGTGFDGRVVNWPRGRVIGGSSSINGLIFIRGQHEILMIGRPLAIKDGHIKKYSHILEN